MIKLTQIQPEVAGSGDREYPIWVNPDHIVLVQAGKDGRTVVCLSGDKPSFYAKESPGEVARLVSFALDWRK